VKKSVRENQGFRKRKDKGNSGAGQDEANAFRNKKTLG